MKQLFMSPSSIKEEVIHLGQLAQKASDKTHNKPLKELFSMRYWVSYDSQVCYETATGKFFLIPYDDRPLKMDITECLYDEINHYWTDKDKELFNAGVTLMGSPITHSQKSPSGGKIIEELLSRYFWDTPDRVLLTLDEAFLVGPSYGFTHMAIKYLRETTLEELKELPSNNR